MSRRQRKIARMSVMRRADKDSEANKLLRLVAETQSDLALAAARGAVRKYLGYDRAKDLRNDYQSEPRWVDYDFEIDRIALAEARHAFIDKYIHN